MPDPRLIATCAACALLVPLSSLQAETVPPLKRVALSSAGLGYFEHEASIEGDTTLTLTVPKDQIDDVLKSLVIEGAKQSSVSVRLPGSEPLSRSFRDFPFSPAALHSSTQLLRELAGAEVSLEGPAQIKGKLMWVEEEAISLPDNRGMTTQHRIGILTKEGLKQAILQDIDTLRFENEKLRQQLSRALEISAAARENGPRQVDIVLPGEGTRMVRIGYVVDAPIWKTAYRVRLGKNDQARLQGWAILENTSGQNWDNVELSLLSGNPVTFRQPLYQAYYTDRPIVPVETPNRMLPVVDQGEMGADERAKGGMMGKLSGIAPAASPRAHSAPAPMEAEGQWDRKSMMMQAEMLERDQSLEESAPLAGAAASESQSQIVLKLPQHQTLSSGQSLMVPILDLDIPAVRHTLLEGNKPVIAVEVANTSATGLPPGAITFYDESGASSYLGDGRIGALPAGEKRLVGFGADLNVRVLAEPVAATSQISASVVDGTLHLVHKTQRTRTFRLKSSAPEKRVVVIDFPRGYQETLIEPKPDSSGISLVANGYRLRYPLEAKKEDMLKIVTETVNKDVWAFDQVLSSAALLQETNIGSAANQATKDLFVKIAEINKQRMDAEAALIALNDQRDTILSEQERIRSNLERVPNGSDLQKRYLKQMGEQEDRISALLKAMETEKGKMLKAEEELKAYLSRNTRN